MTASKACFGGILIVMQIAAKGSLVQQRIWLETLQYLKKITYTCIRANDLFPMSLLHSDLS